MRPTTWLTPTVWTAAFVALSTSCGAGSMTPATLQHGTNTEGSSPAGTADANQPASATSSPDATVTTQPGDPGIATPNAPNSSVPAAPVKGLRMGVLPDYDNSSTNGLVGYISRTSTTPGATSGYVNVGPGDSIETTTGLRYIAEAKAAGVDIVSLSLTAKQTGALTQAQLDGLSSFIAEAQKQNITLWLRYGYEMNFGGGDGQYANINQHNDPTDYKKQWAQVAALANPHRAESPPVKMYWAPNIQSGGDLPYASWEPEEPTTIDVVGVDWYHKQGDAISTASIVESTKDIYAIADALKVPFVLGETAVSTTSKDAAEANEKLAWLAALTAKELQEKLPLYQGFFWFDYEKGGTNFALSQDSYAVAPFTAWYQASFGSAATATPGSTSAVPTSTGAEGQQTDPSSTSTTGTTTTTTTTASGSGTATDVPTN